MLDDPGNTGKKYAVFFLLQANTLGAAFWETNKARGQYLCGSWALPAWIGRPDAGQALTALYARRNRKRGVNVFAMQRRLVLTNEGAGHPMRRRLPPPPAPKPVKDQDQDWKLFALSFTAFFICFYTFIF